MRIEVAAPPTRPFRWVVVCWRGQRRDDGGWRRRAILSTPLPL
ncbi:MAG: hypothetical protein ACODAG_00105 [Myxococcota bacterium]